MKRVFLTFAGIFISFLISYGQIVPGAGTNIFPKEGNVGIGTKNPEVPLHVKVDYSPFDDKIIRIETLTQNDYEEEFDIWDIRSQNGTLSFWYKHDDPNNTSEFNKRLMINEYGNLGIGVMNSFSKLHINGNTVIGFNDPLDAPENGLLVSGRVGFDITNPLAELQIGEQWTYNNPDRETKIISYNAYFFQQTAHGYEYKLIENGKGSGIKFTREGEIILSTIPHGNAGDIIEEEDWINSLEVDNGTGYVGIFNGSPESELDVIGTIRSTNLKIAGYIEIDDNIKLYSDGRIWAKEIQVALVNPWADFVFDDNYKLKTLEEVEKYIKDNKHLPDIPSAEEVQEKGINVAEMNALLLQKIEELTLYVIEQDKRILELENQQKNQ